jgi:hypothetical protein
VKRLPIAALVLAIAIPGTALAAGPVPDGKFKGTTKKGDPMGLRVVHNSYGTGVSKFFFEGVRLKCEDGYKFDSPKGKKRWHFPKGAVDPINDDRSWQVVYEQYDPWGVYVNQGQFSANGNKTTGELQIRVHVTSSKHRLTSPDKGVACTSPALKFTLKRQ